MRRLLLTPGPLTTSVRTRAAMQVDWGSRDPAFVALSEGVRGRLAALCGADAPRARVLVPIQGSGTFALEAMVQTLLPRDGHMLVMANGAYGRRLATIAGRVGRAVTLHESPEDAALDPGVLQRLLEQGVDRAGGAISHVGLVHMETTSGVLNPLAGLAAVAAAHKRDLLIDAIGSVGAIPIPAGLVYAGLAGSANKGLESVPGLAFVCADGAALAAAAGRASSLVLDLHDQARGFAQNGQWRFTPPTHAVAALAAALDQLEAEGGVEARHARYRANCDTLLAGMEALGFEAYLPRAVQGAVIATFRIPSGGWFAFDALYEHLQARGIVIYPGKLTREPSFRIGCIGDIGPDDMRRALAEIGGYVAAVRPVEAEGAGLERRSRAGRGRAGRSQAG